MFATRSPEGMLSFDRLRPPQVAALADPVGRRQLHTELDDGLVLERLSVPLGVLGVIFEARPDAVMQIASLAIRSRVQPRQKGAMLQSMRRARSPAMPSPS